SPDATSQIETRFPAAPLLSFSPSASLQQLPISRMERLNTKLYEKYRDLKKRKISEESERNAKVQAEFDKYLSGKSSFRTIPVLRAEACLWKELHSENNQLRAQISSLEDSQAEYKQTLMEETRKVKEFSRENETLRNLVPAEDHSNNKIGDVELVLTETPNRVFKAGSQDIGELVAPSSNTPNDLQKNVADSIHHNNHQEEPFMPDCCRRNLSSSGDEKEADCAKCVYQILVESLVGMKFAVERQTDGFRLSITHQSSGYSFSLTWTRKGDEEGQLFYHVLSLGTIERVALEWMKEDLVFSTAMSRIFFERICRVIGRPT
ncbi:hypothetical protein Taro_047937, partial [Colocasia esculenta]|nr:hypothetical protein [Colocasia esculenta]